ncbi:MAG: 50S ribosomal protein L9 [Xanthomonadales bacterium]|nr:50S ribosomal protein L9 [Gammaproteobacteria bacterium]MBT8072127.1 50S ribosomal protein L9 [Gammaproteobacteria bacterium]MBT8074921.1 50S ribosomal protein L9 [Gammaproteobacteria bacterium]NNK02967.1 50S ribosomal protein L9 [Xanthomonadales bacterium]NNK97748.1 50S ribosomal protein L9 [Xanthomonadales bacterium]
MDLILLEKVQNLGDLGDLVKVKSGYGRNYLVPQGMAAPATKENLAQFEARRAELEAAAKDKLGQAQARHTGLDELAVEITANASEEGSLYGSIGPREIANAVSALGHELEKSEVIMGEGPLRHVGEFDVLVQLHSDVEATLKVTIHPE